MCLAKNYKGKMENFCLGQAKESSARRGMGQRESTDGGGAAVDDLGARPLHPSETGGRADARTRTQYGETGETADGGRAGRRVRWRRCRFWPI